MIEIVNESDLRLFINKYLKESTFGTFSKLFNLEDKDNYKNIFSLLARKQISLSDVENLPIVNDEYVGQFIANYEKNYFPLPSNGSSTNFVAADWLLSVSSPIKTMIVDYNDKENNGLLTNNIYKVPYISYRATVGGLYSNLSDFKHSFDDKALNEILTGLSVTDVATLQFSPNSDNCTDQMKEFVTGISSQVNSLNNKLSNDKLFNYIVALPDSNSAFGVSTAIFNNVFNYKTTSKVISFLITNEIFNINALGKAPDEAYMEAKYTNVVKSIKNYPVFDDMFATMKFYIQEYLLATESGNNSLINKLNADLSLIAEYEKFFSNVRKVFDLTMSATNKYLLVNTD
jgi:hypothetical protein